MLPTGLLPTDLIIIIIIIINLIYVSGNLAYKLIGDTKTNTEIKIDDNSGCKENHFYSLPFGQAEANIY